MDYVIIGLLSVLVILIVFLILKSNKHVTPDNRLIDQQKEVQNELKIYLKDEYGELKKENQKEYGNLKLEIQKLMSDSSKSSQTDLNTFKDNMMTHIERQLKAINDKVEERLGKGFEDTNKTFTSVIERLGRIDEAQKKIESLSTQVVSLNDLLTDKKTRGIFGEVQLYQLLSAVLGDNKQLYEKQKTLSNGFIADAIVYAPDPVGMVAIDSKFPLDNYKRMVDRNLGDADRKQAEKDFKSDIKKHITDIKTKYIIVNETGDQAFMFVPAEAIFAEISAYHEDLVDFANKNSVWLVSPTTLISTLTMIQMVVKNLERDEQAQVIIEELKKLGDEFKRYTERWDKLKRSIESVQKNAEQVHTTSSKISKKFKHISEAKFDLIEEPNEVEIEDLDDENID
ncbi:MAG: DNA recombination protein RmuC [Acholeplasmataceae bacterium]|jgi:DNA recombination protein RmuC|nr:DNA recombination protein RmuC [Acholeplasmataceae bacterium]